MEFLACFSYVQDVLVERCLSLFLFGLGWLHVDFLMVEVTLRYKNQITMFWFNTLTTFPHNMHLLFLNLFALSSDIPCFKTTGDIFCLPKFIVTFSKIFEKLTSNCRYVEKSQLVSFPQLLVFPSIFLKSASFLEAHPREIQFQSQNSRQELYFHWPLLKVLHLRASNIWRFPSLHNLKRICANGTALPTRFRKASESFCCFQLLASIDHNPVLLKNCN